MQTGGQSRWCHCNDGHMYASLTVCPLNADMDKLDHYASSEGLKVLTGRHDN